MFLHEKNQSFVVPKIGLAEKIRSYFQQKNSQTKKKKIPQVRKKERDWIT